MTEEKRDDQGTSSYGVSRQKSWKRVERWRSEKTGQDNLIVEGFGIGSRLEVNPSL